MSRAHEYVLSARLFDVSRADTECMYIPALGSVVAPFQFYSIGKSTDFYRKHGTIRYFVIYGRPCKASKDGILCVVSLCDLGHGHSRCEGAEFASFLSIGKGIAKQQGLEIRRYELNIRRLMFSNNGYQVVRGINRGGTGNMKDSAMQNGPQLCAHRLEMYIHLLHGVSMGAITRSLALLVIVGKVYWARAFNAWGNLSGA